MQRGRGGVRQRGRGRGRQRGRVRQRRRRHKGREIDIGMKRLKQGHRLRKRLGWSGRMR